MQELKVKFLDGGKANGHSEKVLEKIWADWEKFASYAFNKSHATCYSWVAYQTAYLKANYPAEYMAGVLSRNLNNLMKLSFFMDECKALKIPVNGPDINESAEKFSVTKNGEIRFGLGAIKSLGANAVSSILKERKENGSFKDIFDFAERVNLSACNRSAVEALAFSGAFDCFPEIKREMFAPAPQGEVGFSEVLVRYGQRYQADRNSSQASLFGGFEEIQTEHPALPKVEEWAPIHLLDQEKKLVGMYLSAHPLDPYYMEIEFGCNTRCAEYHEAQTPGNEILMGGLVTSLQERISKKGLPWGLLSIEDFSGTAEIRLFGEKYLEYKKFGEPGTPVLIRAAVEPRRFDPNTFDVNVGNITLLSEMRASLLHDITIYLDDTDSDSAAFKEIHSLMEEPGHAQVDLYFHLAHTPSGGTIILRSRKKVSASRKLVNVLNDNGIPFRFNLHAKENY